jgi:tetratricopeptide (TPR) repeat protein
MPLAADWRATCTPVGKDNRMSGRRRVVSPGSLWAGRARLRWPLVLALSLLAPLVTEVSAAMDSRTAAAYRGKARALGRAGRWEEAETTLKQAREQGASDLKTQCCRAWVLGGMNRPEEGLAICQELLRSYPNSAALQLRTAYLSGHANRWEEAQQAVAKALDLEPGLSRAHCCKGWLKSVRGRWPEATASYRKASELDPRSASAYFNLARCYGNMHQVEEAITYLDRARRLGRDDIRSHCCTGWLANKAKHWETAAEELEAACATDPRRAPAHYLLANVYLHLDRLDEAWQLCQKARKIDPLDPRAICCEGRLQNRRGHPREAEKDFRQALRAGLDLPLLRLGLADSLLRLGRYQEGLTEAKQALKLDARSAAGHCCLGLAYGRLGRWQEAVKEFDRAIEMQPDLPHAEGNRAWAGEHLKPK